MKEQLSSIAALSVVLVLLGAGLLLLLHVTRIEQAVKSAMDIAVELDPDYSHEQRKAVEDALASNERVVATSIQHITKEEAVQLMAGETLDTSLLEQNPFSDLITFNLAPHYYNDDVLHRLSEALQSMEGVRRVSFQNAAAADISGVVRRLAIGLVILGIILTILAAVLLNATTRMRLGKDKKLIETMQLVGARRSYIERPYLRIAVIQAVSAALMATVVLVVGAFLVHTAGVAFLSWPLVLVVVVALSLIAIAQGVISTRRTIASYLRP